MSCLQPLGLPGYFHKMSKADSNSGDEAILAELKSGRLSIGKLSIKLAEDESVRVRRKFLNVPVEMPYEGFAYERAAGVCCENMVGFVPVPVGMAGPLVMDGAEYWIPMATTEGALVASTSRGCKAIRESGGVQTCLLSHQMTRGPVFRADSLSDATMFKTWLDANLQQITSVFEATSKHIRLLSVKATMAGRYVFVRFAADTDEAMGMNMVSKATQAVIDQMIAVRFPQVRLISLSGNYCADKKATSLNWIEGGRGWSVIAEATIPKEVCARVLGFWDVEKVVELALAKNFIGSTMAGALPGGQNAHAANLVAAIFLATGQDIAQVVESSACMTICERNEEGGLLISCTMPCIEVGTVGGGTGLPAQKATLSLLMNGEPKASLLARLICGTVLAGELSLLAALSTNSLVHSHLRLNRTKP